MAKLHAMIATGEVCCCLRSKSLYYQTDDHEDRPGEPAVEAGPFWCAQTQSVLGPDGKVADTESCRSGRGCCQTA